MVMIFTIILMKLTVMVKTLIDDAGDEYYLDDDGD